MKRRMMLGWVSGLVLVAVIGVIVKVYATPLRSLPADRQTVTTVRFFAIGDQGSGQVIQWLNARSMATVADRSGGIDFVLLLGDNFYPHGVSSSDDWQWNSKFENVYAGASLNVPFYALLGNHDYEGKPQAQIDYGREQRGSNRWRMPAQHYTVNYGLFRDGPLLRMIVIDTNVPSSDGAEELAFLTYELSRPQARWTIVAGHHPLVSYGEFRHPSSLMVRVGELLERYRVDAYLSGHDHNRQVISRTGHPLYVISGAGGRQPCVALDTGDPSLVFHSMTPGFFELSLDASTLDLIAYDDTGERDYALHLSADALPHVAGREQ